MGGEKPGPILGRHDGSTILCTDQLAEITCCRLIDYTSQIIQRADVLTAKLPLDEASTVQFSFPLRHRFHFAQQPSLRYPTLHCTLCRKPTLLLLQYCWRPATLYEVVVDISASQREEKCLRHNFGLYRLRIHLGRCVFCRCMRNVIWIIMVYICMICFYCFLITIDNSLRICKHT